MNWIKNQWALLKKYGFAFSFCIQTGTAFYFFVRAFMAGDTYKGMCYGCFGIMFIMMDLLDVVTANLNSRRDIYKDKFADTNDKLILANHEVERLKLELETTQSALKKASKEKHFFGHVQTGLAQTEEAPEARTASIDTAEANADVLPASKPNPHPKRRPAPKRKPKQTEHENKD